MAYCTKCGKPLADGAKFCSKCGASTKFKKTGWFDMIQEKLKDGCSYVRNPDCWRKHTKRVMEYVRNPKDLHGLKDKVLNSFSKLDLKIKKVPIALLPISILILVLFFIPKCGKSSRRDSPGIETSGSTSDLFMRCTYCEGSGICSECGGDGVIVIYPMGVPVERGCASCYPGTGVCSLCKGTGEIRKRR